VREVSRFARSLGHPARLSVVSILLTQGETAAMDLVRALPLSQPACSRHLAALKRAGLVRVRENGAQVHYSLNKGHVRALVQAFQKALTDKR